jgi:hypothetical protein
MIIFRRAKRYKLTRQVDAEERKQEAIKQRHQDKGWGGMA